MGAGDSHHLVLAGEFGWFLQAYRATDDIKYLDLAASTMVRYLDELQQDNGLFHHTQDTPIHWGRGNGWVASGMSEMMRDLDEGHEHFQAIYDGYMKMMEGLLPYKIQSGEGEGLWYQVIDYDGAGNWAETSCSAMFTYAMVSGVKKGWLDEDIYGPAARNAWIGLVGYLEPDGKLREVCTGTWTGDLSHYLNRQRIVGDNHGQAPMMWAAATLLR